MSLLHNRGIQLALATALISGVANFVNKYAVAAIQPPLVFTAVKNTGVGLLVIAVILLLGKSRQLKNLTRKDWGMLSLVGLVGGALPFYLFFTGLSQIPALNAALIHKTLVVWVALLAIPFLKEKLTFKQALAILFLFGSNILVGGFQGFKYSTGELMVLGATLLWAVENVIAKRALKHLDSDILVSARMGLGSLILLVAAAIAHPTPLANSLHLTGNQWFWLSLTAATLLGYTMTWYRALKIAPATTVATVLVSATLVTNVLSALFTTHTWDWLLAGQAGLTVAGLGLLVWQSRQSLVLPAVEEIPEKV